MSIKNIFNTQISTHKGKSFILLFTGNVPSNVFFLAEQNFSLLGDISGTWAKTFFIPDLYSAHKKVWNF